MEWWMNKIVRRRNWCVQSGTYHLCADFDSLSLSRFFKSHFYFKVHVILCETAMAASSGTTHVYDLITRSVHFVL